MFRNRVFGILLGMLTVSFLAAQTGSVGGPPGGMVFDEAARAIRPIVGVPGASYLGEAIVHGVDFASIAPDGDMAVAGAGDSVYLVRGLSSGTADWRLLEKPGRADLVSWTADSSSSAIYTAASGQLRVWSGLRGAELTGVTERPNPRQERLGRGRAPGTPQPTDLGIVAGEVTALAAVSEESALAGVKSDNQGGVFLVSREAGPSAILQTPYPAAITLANDGRDLIVADRGRQEILVVRDYRLGGGAELLAGAGGGVTDPVALALSDDGAALWIASAAARKLMALDLTTRAIRTEIPLDFSPSRLERLGWNRSYLLNAPAAGRNPCQVLTDGPAPKVRFVPAGELAAR